MGEGDDIDTAVPEVRYDAAAGVRPAWFALAPSLGPEVLVLDGPSPGGQWAGVVAPHPGMLGTAGPLVAPGGWLLAAGTRRAPRGYEVVERHLVLPDLRRARATLPVVPGGSRFVLRTLFLPYAAAGRGRRLRRALVLVLPHVLSRVPVRVLARVVPSHVLLLRRRP